MHGGNSEVNFKKASKYFDTFLATVGHALCGIHEMHWFGQNQICILCVTGIHKSVVYCPSKTEFFFSTISLISTLLKN